MLHPLRDVPQVEDSRANGTAIARRVGRVKQCTYEGVYLIGLLCRGAFPFDHRIHSHLRTEPSAVKLIRN